MPDNSNDKMTAGPVRGSLRLTINTSSPKISAGSDFSIFVVIQNPFDIPITIYKVQTHIPIELIDMNGLKLDKALRERERKPTNIFRDLFENWRYGVQSRDRHTGIAIAVGTDFDPRAEAKSENIFTTVDGEMHVSGSVYIGTNFVFPNNPTAEELDRVFRRFEDYKKGLTPITLQPGDSVVRQFVLRDCLKRFDCRAIRWDGWGLCRPNHYTRPI